MPDDSPPPPTGMTTVCSARRVTVQVPRIDAVEQGVGVASTPITRATGAVGVAVEVPLGDGVIAVGLGAISAVGPSPTLAQAERTRAVATDSQRAAAPSRCGRLITLRVHNGERTIFGHCSA